MQNDEILINRIRSYPALWDLSDKCYHDKLRKENSWKLVAIKCGFASVEACKNKWKALREKYRRETKTMDHLYHSGTGQIIRKPWSLYHHMGFLKDKPTSRSTCSNLLSQEVSLEIPITDETQGIYETDNASRTSTSSYESNSAAVLVETAPSTNYDLLLEEAVMEINSDQSDHTYYADEVHAHHADTQASRKPGKKRKSETIEVTEVLQKIGTAVEAISQTPENNFTAFTTYVTEELKALPNEDAQRVMDDFVLAILNCKKKIRQHQTERDTYF